MVEAAARRHRCRTPGRCLVSRINVMRPWFGDEEVDAVAEVLASGWVAQGPRVAEFEPLRPAGGRARSGDVELHHRPAPRARGRGRGRGRRRGRAVVLVHRDCQRPDLRRRPTRLRRRRRRDRQPHCRDRRGWPSPARPGRSSRSTRAASRSTWTRSARSATPRHRRHRGRGLRRGIDAAVVSRSVPVPRSPPGRSTRARSSPPARAACSPPAGPTGLNGPAGCVSTG